MTLAPGRELSHYRLVERIGEGGMGIVWRATDTTLGRDVAIKVLPEAFVHDPERMGRFEREARVLASLNHPNIAAIYGVGSAEGVRFLALELVTGDDLAARVAHGPISVVEALETARQVAEALEAAHEKGVIHRDLKPANVKVTADGHAKVLDFGLAKALEDEAAPAGSAASAHSPTLIGPVTGANIILGTAAYMSPEQARGKAVDRRADIWAFGCVLFECLTGRQAFAGETVSDTLAKILEREPDLQALPRATPPRVRELLQRCLVKDPKLRLRDIGDARIVLEEVLATRSPSGRLPAAEPEVAGSAPRRTPLGALAVASIVGLGLGAGLWSLLGPRIGGRARTEPTCVSLSIPPGITVLSSFLAPDGRTLVIRGQAKEADGSGPVESRLYTRRLDRYEFEVLNGTEGAVGITGIRDGVVHFVSQVSPGATQWRLAAVPLDGSSPVTTIADWKESWIDGTRLSNGDFLVREGDMSFVRLSPTGGAPSSPVKMDAGRSGVSRIEFTGNVLPEDRRILVNVVSYDARGWHHSVGVMNPEDGKVEVVEEDGGNAVYSPTGHLVFARGDAILAAPFDPESARMLGPPVAVWSGLSTPWAFYPGEFRLTEGGTLIYRPGQVGADRSFAILDAGGRLESWSPERHAVTGSLELSPDGRRFACTIASARGIEEVWISPVDRAEFHRLGTDPNADCMLPVWSPDGARIAYYRLGKDGRDGLYVQDADGGEARRMLAPESDQVRYLASAWLPDGSGVLATRQSAGRTSLVRLPLRVAEADSARPQPVLPDDFARWLPRLSRDGRLLAFGSDETGKPQIWVAEMRSGGVAARPVQVRVSGEWHSWGPDGRTLFVEDERNRLMKFSVSLGPPLSVSAPVEVADLKKLGIRIWSALPDGRFLVGLMNENEDDITRFDVVLHWTALLENRGRSGR